MKGVEEFENSLKLDDITFLGQFLPLIQLYQKKKKLDGYGWTLVTVTG